MRAAWYERRGPAREVLIVGEKPDRQQALGASGSVPCGGGAEWDHDFFGHHGA
jgi:hypothetical protein